MRKKIFNKTTTSIIAAIGFIVGGLLVMKVVADSQSKVPY